MYEIPLEVEQQMEEADGIPVALHDANTLQGF